MPRKPGAEWWIGKTVASAKQSISNPNVWAILCTARQNSHAGLRYRIAELLKQRGLSFDEVHLSPGGDPVAYKIGTMMEIIKRNPHIKTVHIWEDALEHLPKFVSAIEATGRTCIPHPIKDRPMPAGCGEQDIDRLVEDGWRVKRAANSFERQGDALVGYKVVAYDPDSGSLVSGANSRIRLDMRKGAVHEMPRPGIFLAARKRHVMDYYANHEINALVTYLFDPRDVTTGRLDDREPEITVTKAVVENVELFDEDGEVLRSTRVASRWLTANAETGPEFSNECHRAGRSR